MTSPDFPCLDDPQAVLDYVRRDLAEKGLTEPDEHAISTSLRGRATVETLLHVQREISGLGVLAIPLAEPGVTDVVLNGDGRVWSDTGSGMTPYPTDPLTPEAARTIAVRLATACGQRLDDAQPCADGVLRHLPPGVAASALRVHAILAPPAGGGACISLRTINEQHNRLGDLQATGLMDGPTTELLRRIVHARKNVLISGGTGAGKTTLLAALLAETPHHERLVVIEDTPELAIDHPHIVSMHTRHGNAEGAGAITMQHLLKQSLRMRPDRLIVGEIRGAEVADLLVALNTGHGGSAGTIHANEPAAIPGRLEALGAMGGLPLVSLRRQATDGIDVLIHVAKTPAGRRITHIATMVRVGEACGVDVVWNGQPMPGFEEFCAGLHQEAA